MAKNISTLKTARVTRLRAEIRERQDEIARILNGEDVSTMPLDAMTREQHEACGCGACQRWLLEARG